MRLRERGMLWAHVMCALQLALTLRVICRDFGSLASKREAEFAARCTCARQHIRAAHIVQRRAYYRMISSCIPLRAHH